MEKSKCACKGIRSCALCADPAYRENFKHLKATTQTLEELKEGEIETITYRLENGGLSPQDSAASLSEQNQASLQFQGLYLVEGFLSEEQQREFQANLDRYEWKPSQSGRRKQDYGPVPNFKKQKLKLGSFKGFPPFIRPYLERLREALKEPLETFRVAELNALEYTEESGSSIAPHFDDFWLWGERIIGFNLLSPTVMTFSRKMDIDERKLLVEVEVPVPAGAVYLMTGDVRNVWQHGIKAEHIKGRRLVCTLRELTPELETTEIGQEILRIAQTDLE